MIKVHATKTASLDNDIVKSLLQGFIDWLDENEFIVADKHEFNSDLVAQFVDERGDDE